MNDLEKRLKISREKMFEDVQDIVFDYMYRNTDDRIFSRIAKCHREDTEEFYEFLGDLAYTVIEKSHDIEFCFKFIDSEIKEHFRNK